jgi:hypothetical protein
MLFGRGLCNGDGDTRPDHDERSLSPARRRSFSATTAPKASIAPQRVALRSTPATSQPPPDFPLAAVDPGVPLPPPGGIAPVPVPVLVPPGVAASADAETGLLPAPSAPPAPPAPDGVPPLAASADPLGTPLPASTDPLGTPLPASTDPLGTPLPASTDPLGTPLPASADPLLPPPPASLDPLLPPPLLASADPLVPPPPASLDPLAPPPPPPASADPLAPPLPLGFMGGGLLAGYETQLGSGAVGDAAGAV